MDEQVFRVVTWADAVVTRGPGVVEPETSDESLVIDDITVPGDDIEDSEDQ